MINRKSELEGHLHNLRTCRGQLEELESDYKRQKEAFEAETEELRADIEAERESVSLAEDVVRALAIDWYTTDDSTKTLPCGVKIAVSKQIEYNEESALAWAKSKGMAVKLDAKAFKDLVRSGVIDDIPATVEEVPTVRLPRVIDIGD